jgi:DNA-binding MarR family transcriptional regulator
VEGLARLDVTPSQFKVILSLRKVDSLGQRQLAELIGIDPRNRVPIIDSLVEGDLVSRQIDDTDRRRRELCLTKRGRQLASKLEAVNAEIEVTLMSPPQPEGTHGPAPHARHHPRCNRSRSLIEGEKERAGLFKGQVTVTKRSSPPN